MRIERFKPEHLAQLELQDSQAYFCGQIAAPEYAESLVSPTSFTGMVDGKVIACAGCLEVWSGRAIAWALVSKDAGQHMMQLHRAVAGYMMAAPYRRIEAWVDDGFEAGHRWLKMLGFTLETPVAMQGFRPDGGACFLYARVK